jgi:hypothetical protein
LIAGLLQRIAALRLIVRLLRSGWRRFRLIRGAWRVSRNLGFGTRLRRHWRQSDDRHSGERQKSDARKTMHLSFLSDHDNVNAIVRVFSCSSNNKSIALSKE